jgi:hypothetical protein
VRIFGKGRKERFCPLWPQTAQTLRAVVVWAWCTRPRTRGSIALWVATVWLYVDNNAEAEATWRNWVPLLRYMMPAEVLYHEIGHHIHAVHRPIHDGRETFAEDWSRKLWGRFCRKHYWYLFPFLYVFALLASPIVKRYLTFAIRKTHSLPKFRPARWDNFLKLITFSRRFSISDGLKFGPRCSLQCGPVRIFDDL